MTGKTTFAPTIVLDGRTVQPEGWMWTLGFAMAGVQWAVDAAAQPEFAARVAAYRKRCREDEALQQIAYHQREIKRHNAVLNHDFNDGGGI